MASPRPRRFLLPAAAAAAAFACLVPTVPAAVETILLHDATAALPTAGEVRDGYARTAFRHWIDDDRVIWSQKGHMAA